MGAPGIPAFQGAVFRLSHPLNDKQSLLECHAVPGLCSVRGWLPPGEGETRPALPGSPHARCPVSHQLRRARVLFWKEPRAPMVSSEPSVLSLPPDKMILLGASGKACPRASTPVNGSVIRGSAGVPRTAPGVGPTAVQLDKELTRQMLPRRLCSLHGRQRSCREDDISEDRKEGLCYPESVPTAFHEADLFSTWNFL